MCSRRLYIPQLKNLLRTTEGGEESRIVTERDSELHMQDIVLSENEIQILNALAKTASEHAVPVEDLLVGRQLSYEQGLSAIGYLCAKGLAEPVEIGTEQKCVLRKLGQEYEQNGLPEKRLWHHLVSKENPAMNRGSTLKEVNDFLPPSEAKFTIGMFLGAFQRAGLVAFTNGRITVLQEALPESIENLQRYLTHVKETSMRDPHNPAEEEANRRKLIEDRPITILSYRLTSLGRQHARLYEEIEMQSMIGDVTREMLLNGEWRDKQFRPLSVVAPPEIRLEVQHPLPRFLTYLRRSLAYAGFREVASPILETEFWNLNVLFMQKYHPVRSSKHLLAIEGISLAEDSPEVEARTYACQQRFAREYQGLGTSGSRGWGSIDGFQNDRVVMRSHSTPVTVRQLANTQDFPLRVFGFSRCCRARPERPEFIQMDVLVADADLNVSTFMGTIRQVCLAIFPRAIDIRVEALYFPFAEISVDIFIVYAEGRSVQIGSAGLLRPESLAILDVPVPVGLIGFNISRLARFLVTNPKALDPRKPIDPNSIGFDAYNETEIPEMEIPINAQR
jgi:phenylalanyl-tRNA synthetase alpha chain